MLAVTVLPNVSAGMRLSRADDVFAGMRLSRAGGDCLTKAFAGTKPSRTGGDYLTKAFSGMKPFRAGGDRLWTRGLHIVLTTKQPYGMCLQDLPSERRNVLAGPA